MSPATVSGFDRIASSYSAMWSDAASGRLQREAFWRTVAPLFAAGESVLDLGCGTGDDAEWLTRRGVRVAGIDSSAEMVRIAQERGVDTRVLRIEDIGTLHRTFDGAISNFGAMNCVERLPDVREPLARIIRQGGYLALCLLGRFCLWESVWYAVRGELRKAGRRWGGEAASSLGVRVYYPTIAEAEAAMRPDFRLVRAAGAGVFVPPSFVTGLSERSIEALGRIDRIVADKRVFRALADHRILVFRRDKRR